jgi:hypothetical protein
MTSLASMNGPSVTPPARTVLAFDGTSSWAPPSASLPLWPVFSYQAPTSDIHASCSLAVSDLASGVSMIRITYFTACLRLAYRAPLLAPPHWLLRTASP